MTMDNTSIEELTKMMEASDMSQFCDAAKALVHRNSKEAYEVLKKYVFSTDAYKKRYVLSVIFEYPYAMELVDELKQILRTEKTKDFIINTVVEILIKYNIKIDEDIIIQVLKNSDEEYGWYYQVIQTFDKNEENLEKLLELYRLKTKFTSVRIFMAEELLNFVNEENYMQLFQLFANDEQPHIRLGACKIADKMDRADLLMSLKDDSDGHIRKYVNLKEK